ncbi:MAG: DUF6056 family protein [Velocimicrobium sp.]
MEEEKHCSIRGITIIVSLIFILSVLPLFYIGIYAHPNADDYSYGIHTKHVWETTHSFSQVLESAFEGTADKYYHWQGNFSAIFLMHLQPGIFGESYYFLAPFLLLSTFLLFSLFFYYTIFRKILKNTPVLSLLSSLIITFFALQFTHVPSDSFYWYNGAIYYTYFYSLSLLLYGILIQLHYQEHLYSKILLVVVSSILSFLIGGSNYATSLLNAILLFFTVVYFIYKKSRHVLFYLPSFVFGLFALLISISGPGNTLRQTTIGTPHNPITAILLSFVYSGYSIINATTVPVFLFWFLLIPIFWKMSDQISHTFHHPLYVFLFSFCIYSAQITPVIYAQGIRIPYRIRNIVGFHYYIFVAFNLFYFLGYLKQSKGFPSLTKPFPLRFYYIGLIFAIVIFCLGRIEVTENSSGNIELSNLTFSASAFYSLVINEAQSFDAEENTRARILEISPSKDIVLSPIMNHPYVLFHSDISKDPSFWKNQHLARYYNKRTVRLK